MKKVIGLLSFVVGIWSPVVAPSAAQVPLLINYQGRLVNGTNLYNGPAGIAFNVHTNEVTGAPVYQSTTQVAVVDGLYSARIGEFETLGTLAGALTNAELWLELVVNGTALAPRERIVSVAYSLMTDAVKPGGVTSAMLADGTVTGPKIAAGAVSNAHLAANAVTGAKIADGSISNADFSAQTLSNTFWRLAGNAGTVTGTHFLGTTDDQPVEIRANNFRAVLITPVGGAPNVVLGAEQNVIADGTRGASILGGSNNTIGVGSDAAVIAGGQLNDAGAYSYDSTIGGGYDNYVADDSPAATISGGRENAIGISSEYAFIGGGEGNNVSNDSQNAVIGGGYKNAIGTNSFRSVVVGGSFNVVRDNSYHAVVGGGFDNDVAAPYAVIPGGRENAVAAVATNAFAAGRRAKANHRGTFVWADDTGADFSTTAGNQFLIRAACGVAINTNIPGAAVLAVAGNAVDFGPTLSGEGGPGAANAWLRINARTNGEPQIRFFRDQVLESAVYQKNSPNVLAAYVGGGDRLAIDTNGWVGIGTTAPDDHLAVEGSGSNLRLGNTAESEAGIYFVDSQDPDDQFARVAFNAAGTTNQNLSVYVNSTNALVTFKGNQRVGIGTNNPRTQLEVVGNAYFAGAVTSAAFAGNGAQLTGLSGGQLAVGSVSNQQLSGATLSNTFWRLDGNAGTTPGTHFLGTTDNRPVEIRANNLRVALIQPSNGAPNIVLGAEQNVIAVGTRGASILGGSNNTIAASSDYATIAGGHFCDIGTDSDYSAIGGGYHNDVADVSGSATIAGGTSNDIGTNSDLSAIGGGYDNNVGANSQFATIAGGRQNDIGTNSPYATIPGGRDNVIAEDATNAFAAGRQAKANHRGAFVWGDDTAADVASSTNNQVTFRASGGFRIFSNAGMTTGVVLAASSGAWTSISDVNAKEGFSDVDPQAVLEALARIPIRTWRYRGQEETIRHMGPTAQDFHAAFGLGDLPGTGITTVDADGVALAAIQALAKENAEIRSQYSVVRNQNEDLKTEIQKMKARLDAMDAK